MSNIFGGGSNLPPGCRVSDIPGNRPEDVEWEDIMLNFFDRNRIRKRKYGIPISGQEIRAMSAIYRAKKYNNIQVAVDSYISMAIEYGIDIGWQQAKDNQQESKYHESWAIEDALNKANVPNEVIQKVKDIIKGAK